MVVICVCVSVCVGNAWKILLVITRSLWSVLGGGLGKGEPVEAQGERGQHRWGGGQHGRGGGGMGGEGSNGCIMHRVHISTTKKTRD